jgi:ABC-type enterochelin transport system substrate-binding protein
MNILFFILKTKLLLKRVFGKETEMRTLLGTMNEEIEKMKKAVNIDYAPVTLDKSDKKCRY